MKSDLIIKKFKTQYQPGTQMMTETRAFFGSKMMSIEDNITIDDSSIQYRQFWNPNTGLTVQDLGRNGYQAFDSDITNIMNETIFLTNMSDIKLKFHTIQLLQQSDTDLRNNTKWQITIDIQHILEEYLFAQIKAARTFKCITYQDVAFRNINASIYNYIESNLLSRYKLNTFNLYVQYYNILQDNSIYSTTKLQYNPLWDKTVKIPANIVSNVNISLTSLNNLVPIVINYSQTKPSTNYKWDYYFDLSYVRV